MNRLLLSFFFLLLTCQGFSKERWLFLGDSITQQGGYVDYIETWFLLNEVDPPEIISLGLSSETVSGLSEPDHPFPRPYLHSRLENVLERVKPTVVIACYGMNCGIYHPFSAERFSAYKVGIRKLVADAHAIGAEVILLTPPPYAGRVKPRDTPEPGQPYGFKTPASDYNDVLAKYGEWILSRNGRGDLRAFTIRPAMERFMEKIYIKEPIHPNSFGHELMAEAFLQALGKDTGSDILQTGISRRSDDEEWQSLIALVKEQRTAYEFSLLNSIGHGNPNILKRETMPLDDARRKNESLTGKIETLLNNRSAK